jgi:hypothetical protein
MTTRYLIVDWALCFGRSATEASWCCPKRCHHRFESRHLLPLPLLRQRLHLCEHQQHGLLRKPPLRVLSNLLHLWLQLRLRLRLQLRLLLRLLLRLRLQLRQSRLLSHHP